MLKYISRDRASMKRKVYRRSRPPSFPPLSSWPPSFFPPSFLLSSRNLCVLQLVRGEVLLYLFSIQTPFYQQHFSCPHYPTDLFWSYFCEWKGKVEIYSTLIFLAFYICFNFSSIKIICDVLLDDFYHLWNHSYNAQKIASVFSAIKIHQVSTIVN